MEQTITIDTLMFVPFDTLIKNSHPNSITIGVGGLDEPSEPSSIYINIDLPPNDEDDDENDEFSVEIDDDGWKKISGGQFGLITTTVPMQQSEFLALDVARLIWNETKNNTNFWSFVDDYQDTQVSSSSIVIEQFQRLLQRFLSEPTPLRQKTIKKRKNVKRKTTRRKK